MVVYVVKYVCMVLLWVVHFQIISFTKVWVARQMCCMIDGAMRLPKSFGFNFLAYL